LNNSFKEVLNNYLYQYRVSIWHFGDNHYFKDVECLAHQCGWSPKSFFVIIRLLNKQDICACGEDEEW